jgi:Intracellular proteinase inhibitor
VALALDKSSYTAGDAALVRMSLRNTTPTPLRLNFTSSQRYDMVIRNASGTEVFRWSAARSFLAVIGSETVSGGELNYAEVLPLANLSGQALAPGRYSLDAWIANALAPQYAGTVAFDIR